jgi:hypothetical protein
MARRKMAPRAEKFRLGSGCGARARRFLKKRERGGLNDRDDGAHVRLCGVFSPNAFSLCDDVSFYLNSKLSLHFSVASQNLASKSQWRRDFSVNLSIFPAGAMPLGLVIIGLLSPTVNRRA